MTLDRKKVRVFNRSFRENRNMADIYIFDIDGCIMPNLFLNFTEDSDNSGTLNSNLKDEVARLDLFPEFIEFYRHNCINSLAIYFITGRKRKDYDKITEQQLFLVRKFKNFSLKFYPDDKSHIKKDYFVWKFEMITNIISQYRQSYANFYIYDDFKDIIFTLKKLNSFHHNIHCTLIQAKTDWILEKTPLL